MTKDCVPFNIFKMNQIVKFDENHATGKSFVLNLLSANPIKWSNTLKQFVAFCGVGA